MIQSELVAAWRLLSVDKPPYVLEGDDLLLEDDRGVTIESIDELVAHPLFDFSGSGVLHLGLLPVPFVGDLQHADIFILLQNPGFRPTNYYQEFQDKAFRTALVDNLAQRPSPDGFSFFPLNPRFCYGGSYDYWRNKLAGILNALRRDTGISLPDALNLLSRRLAILELFPYHSSVGKMPNRILRRLRSVGLVRRFVTEHLLPRARSGDALIVVTRQARQWALVKEPGVVVYGTTEARSAHLTPNSKGGMAILQRLEMTAGAS